MHEPRFAARFRLAAQVHHVHVQGVGARLEVEAPHRLEDLLAGQHLPRVRQEHLQQGELGTGQLDPARAPGDLAGGEVHPQVGEGQHIVVGDAACRGRVRAAAQQGPDAGEELVQFEGLDQVVVGPGVEPGDAVADGVAGGEHQDGRGGAGGTQAAGGGQTVHPRHLDVEDDQIGGVRLGPGEGVETVDGDFGVVPLEREAALQGLTHRGLVVDDQDALRIVFGGAHRSLSSSRSGLPGRAAWPAVPSASHGRGTSSRGPALAARGGTDLRGAPGPGGAARGRFRGEFRYEGEGQGQVGRAGGGVRGVVHDCLLRSCCRPAGCRGRP